MVCAERVLPHISSLLLYLIIHYPLILVLLFASIMCGKIKSNFQYPVRCNDLRCEYGAFFSLQKENRILPISFTYSSQLEIRSSSTSLALLPVSENDGSNNCLMYSTVMSSLLSAQRSDFQMLGRRLMADKTLTHTKICGLNERDSGPIQAIKLFLRRELSETKRDSYFVALVRLSQTSVWFVYRR